MADERVKITVSYAGREKRIPLVVSPSLELSDVQVEYAESDLHRVVRHIFQLPHESLFYLHEAESGRIMSRETFREPTQLSAFPRHWYLTVESYKDSRPIVDLDVEEKPKLNGPVDYPDLLPLADSRFTPREGEEEQEDDEEDEVRSLAGLSPSDAKYQTITVRCNGQGEFGFTLRHFSIQPSNIPRFDTPTDPPSHSDSRTSTPSRRDSLDTLKLSSTFVRHVVHGGVAEEAGLGKGDVVQMVNGVSIIRSGWEETRELLQQCGDELALLVLPKENDDLQFLYPQYAYGSTGDYTTSEGQVFACDLTVAVGNGSSETKGNEVTVVPHSRSNTSQKLEIQGNHVVVERPESIRTSSGVVPKLDARLSNGHLSVNSPPVGLVPFSVGSAASLDNSNSLSCSNENMVGQPSSADDILISGSLSEIPVALVESPSDKHRFDTNWSVQKKASNDSHLLNGNGEFSELSPTWQNHYSGIQNGEAHSTAGAHVNEFEYTHRELNFISEDPLQDGMEWYRDAADEGAFVEFSLGQGNSISEEMQSSASDTNFLAMNKPRRKSNRTTSQSSLERRHSTVHRVSSHPLTARAALTSSMSALDRMPFPRSQGSESSPSRNKSKSTELGNIRLKRRGKKSLEGLTRIGSGENLRRYSNESERQRLKRHKSDENAHRIVRLSAPETNFPDAWTERPPAPVSTPTRGILGMSDNDSQLSGSLPPPQAQLSGQSEEQKNSGDSGSTTRSTSEISGSGIPFRGRRSVKSYQSQRAQLHKSRSRTETEVGGATTAVGERSRLRRKPSNSGDLSESTELRRASRRGRGRSSTSSPPVEEQLESTEPRRVSRRGRGRSSTSSPPAEDQLQQEQPPLSKKEQPPLSKQDLLPEVKEVQHEEEEPPRMGKPEKLVPTSSAIRQPTVIEPQREEEKSIEPVRRERRLTRERPMSASESSPQLGRHAASLEYRYGATLSPSMTARDHRQSLEIPNNRHKLTRSVEVPMSEYGRRIPLYHTHSAQTPFGEEIVTEFSIDDAIRLYRGLSPSADSGVEASPQQAYGEEGHRRLLYEKQRGVSEEKLYSLTRSSRERGRSTEVLASSPSPTNMAISGMCNGVLSKKQDRAESGKRSHVRSWKTYYAVLIASKIVFYKDRRDAIMSKPCDEPPIVVVPSFTFVAHSYTKKKFVFRVATPHGPEYLLQASDAESMQRWVSTLQALNKGRAYSMELKPREVVESKPYSPIFGRKLASPQPSKPKKKKEEGGGGTRLLDKLKRTLTRRENEEPDYSSFVTFGQPLEDCPVSPENKRVPLVVEYCVKEVETHGLEAEGIYRISGATTLVKDLSTEMDKGNYSLTDYGDIHTIAGLLKKFFKELPDSLIPAAVHDDFVATAREQDEEQRLTHLKDLVYRLPIAHYHTLKYLVAHLNRVIAHSDQNKMTLKNLRIVFGPTLVRTPSDDFSTISDGYTVIELLCKHMEFLFSSELCAEEQKWAEMLEEEEEEALRESPSARRREPRDVETKMQKEQALEKASPMTLRRIKNDFTTVKGVGGGKSSSSDSKRNSFIQIEGTIPLQPKQHNWEGSAQLLPLTSVYHSDTLKSNRSSSPGHRSPETPPQQQVVLGGSIPHRNPKHLQQQLQQQQLQQQQLQQQHSSSEGSDSVSRTRHWVNHHREMGWGKDGERDDSRELRGSMWANRNREPPRPQPRDKKEKRRLAKPRQQLVTSYPSPVEPAHEFLASYSASSPSFRTSSFPSSDIHDIGGNHHHSTHSYQTTKHSTLPLPSSPTTRRRISYTQSMSNRYFEDDTPTRDDRRSHGSGSGSGSLDQHYRQHRHPHHNQQSSGYQSHHQYSAHRQRLARHSSSDSYVDSSPPSDQSLKELHSFSVYSHLKRTGRVSPRHPTFEERRPSFEESPPESRLVHSPYSTAAQVESYL